MEKLLQADNLYRSYGDHIAVNDVSISLDQGDILGLLGPNGAGKTTTMNLLTGNLAPDSGSIVVRGHDLFDAPRAARRHIGYLPEQPPLHRDATVDEYLRYCGRIRGINKRRLKDAVETARQRTGLADTGKRLIANLSKGFQQRVGIAQAIIHEPDIIILDEPTVGLDPIQIREIRALIRELGSKHSVILSSHILPEVQALCNRIHILHQGRICYDDSRQQGSHRQVISLRFGNQIDLRELADTDGVSQVTPADGGFRLECDNASKVAPRIAELAVRQGWQLLAMTPEQPGLEQIFVNLTRGEDRQNQPGQDEKS